MQIGNRVEPENGKAKTRSSIKYILEMLISLSALWGIFITILVTLLNAQHGFYVIDGTTRKDEH